MAEQLSGSAETEISDGQKICGASVSSFSSIVTIKLQVVLLPEASVNTKVFSVLPIGNSAPEAKPAVCSTITPGQESVNEGASYSTILPCTLKSTTNSRFSGQLTRGTVLSITVTI